MNSPTACETGFRGVLTRWGLFGIGQSMKTELSAIKAVLTFREVAK